MKTYFDPDVRVSLEMPEDWEVMASADFPLLLLAAEEQGFRANVGFAIVPLDEPTPERLDQIIADAKSERERDFKRFELLGERRQEQAGYPGYLMRSYWELDEAPVTVAQISAIFVTAPTQMHQVHCTALKDLEQVYLPTFRHILGSLRFIPPEDVA